ncbi:hypothetical protein ACIG3E_32620 [Streptomyces sp. NPDC053474]|uniref:hypothetical protein n=1 Tax=Streptomyces sp. NPDC053474 TaxID=3365704 RepID=UPI0037D55ACF
MNLSLAGQALYLSVRETGALVTPHETAQVLAESVARLGVEGVRVESFRRALACSATFPEEHCARFAWAAAAASFIGP